LRSNIKEIIALSEAINRMKQGLRSFKKYVPANLVRQLIESGKDVLIGGEKTQLAIFFSDIENFTSISERMDPDNLMKYICEYFNEVSPIIVDERGTIDKYIGDSVMAFWGAPLPTEQPCHYAARAAIRCLKRINELNEKWQKQDRPPLNTRIGLHFGEAIVGNLGSNERLNYTAVGDSINMASRLESINKYYGTRIIVSDVLYKEIKHDFALRLIDSIAVMGKARGTSIYELLAENKDELPFNLTEYQKIFALAFAAYEQQQWDVAISNFEMCLSVFPADTVVSIFIRRCRYFADNPPGSNWDGIWRMQEK
jgi:adenylate cyclase